MWTPFNTWAHPTHHAKRQLDRFTHFRRTTQQSPRWLQWDATTSPQNCPSSSTITTPSNTPTPLIIHNGIGIHSAVLPQYTLRTDRQTNRPTDRWSRRKLKNINTYVCVTSPQRHLRKARRSSADKKNSKLLVSHISRNLGHGLPNCIDCARALPVRRC